MMRFIKSLLFVRGSKKLDKEVKRDLQTARGSDMSNAEKERLIAKYTIRSTGQKPLPIDADDSFTGGTTNAQDSGV